MLSNTAHSAIFGKQYSPDGVQLFLKEDFSAKGFLRAFTKISTIPTVMKSVHVYEGVNIGDAWVGRFVFDD